MYVTFHVAEAIALFLGLIGYAALFGYWYRDHRARDEAIRKEIEAWQSGKRAK